MNYSISIFNQHLILNMYMCCNKEVLTSVNGCHRRIVDLYSDLHYKQSRGELLNEAFDCAHKFV